MQDSAANCGAAAVRNALQALGIERTIAELEAACKTTATDGTSTKNIIKALAKIEGCTPILLREKRRDVALMRLHECLRRGRPVVLSWMTESPGDHWIAAVGLLGERFLVADSADNELVLSLEVDVLEKRWWDTRYEGIIL